MDYYDVLGVRPNAGRTEIELAFKGRRAQYHPDRYSGEDAQTLRWATERMQEVNAAYGVLSDADQRRQYDERRSSRASHSKSSAASGAGHRSGVDAAHVELPWREFLADSCVPQLTSSRIFCEPAIPQRKLQGALGSYGEGLDPAEVTLIVDDTIMGGAERGMLIAEQELRLKDYRGTWRLPFEDLYQIRAAGRTIVANETNRTAVLDLAWEVELGCVLATLDEYLACGRWIPGSLKEQDLEEAVQQRVTECCRAHMAAPNYTGAAACSIGAEVPRPVQRMVRFILQLPKDEIVLAVSNLDPYGHAQAFVVTSRGLHAKVERSRTFIPWRELRQLHPVDQYSEGLHVGVLFDDGRRIACSRLRGDGQAFGFALMQSLTSIQ